MIKIEIKKTTRQTTLNRAFLRKIAKATLRSQGIKRGEISLLFTTDSKIKELNRRYLRRKRPTDVLAFSMNEGRPLKGARNILGDVVISVDRARIQSKRFSSTLKKELALYVIHGILHLLGFEDGTKEIKKSEEKILKRFF